MTTTMADPGNALDGLVVEEEVCFTLSELCRACRASDVQLFALVDEGVLTPRGHASAEWVFAGSSLRTARTALRLVDDFELSPAGVALVLDLLAQVDGLRARLRRADLI